MKKNLLSPMVSIIIPIYNAEKYLRTCLDSITTQTCNKFELICIDDGSIDSSLEILAEYSKKIDNKMTVLSTKNSGCSAARNKGIEKSHGEYILFVDADDYIDSSLLEKMLTEAEKSSADIIKCARSDVYNGGSTIVNRKPIWNEKRLIEKKEFCTEVYPQFFGRCRLCTAWATLIKKSLLTSNNISFRTDLTVNEDEVFAIDIFNRANNFIYMPDMLYFYNKNDDGLSNNGADIYARAESRKKHLETLENISKNWNITNREKMMTEKKAFTCIYTAMQTSYKNPKYSKKEQYILFKSILKDSYYNTAIRKCEKTAMLSPEKVTCALANARMYRLAFTLSRMFGTIKNKYRSNLEKIRNE